jgi:hypothetical protein
MHSLRSMVVFWQLWWPFDNNQKLSRMMNKLTFWKIMFHINAPTKFNQDPLESAHEHCNRLQKERRARQQSTRVKV